MSESLADLVPQVDLSIKGSKVTIELLCADAYAASVIFDDIHSKITSGRGLALQLRGVARKSGGDAK